MNLSLLTKYSMNQEINITAMFNRIDEIEKIQWERRDLEPYNPLKLELNQITNEYHDLKKILFEFGYRCENCKHYDSNDYHCLLRAKTSTAYLKTDFCTKCEL